MTLDGLSERKAQELACLLSLLWDEFVTDKGGPAGYLDSARSAQGEYVGSLRDVAERVRQQSAGERAHYALSLDLMALYLAMLGRTELSHPQLEASRRVADLVTQGRLLRAKGKAAPAMRKPGGP